jgi:hypothetical protein
MGGICGAIGITEEDGAARPIVFGRRAPVHPQIPIGSSNRVGARLNVEIKLEERSSQLILGLRSPILQYFLRWSPQRRGRPQARFREMATSYTPGQGTFVGLLPEPETRPLAFLMSGGINVAIAVTAIVIGMTAQHVLQQHYEMTELIVPNTPPPPAVKIRQPPPQELPPPPEPPKVELQPRQIEMPKPKPSRSRSRWKPR